MYDVIITLKDRQNKWERVFQTVLDQVLNLQLVRYGRSRYGLINKRDDDWDWDGLEKDVFKTAQQLIDRIGGYIEDYFITEIEHELRAENIACPTDEEILNGDKPFYITNCEWYWRLYNLLPRTEPKRGAQFIAERQLEYDVLDLLLHHRKEVNLANISAIVPARKNARRSSNK